MRPLVKVCGMTRASDVEDCLALGADLLGFIFHPKSPRNVDPAFPASVRTGGRALKVGVFVDQAADEVLEVMGRAGLDLAQLHGGQDEAFCRRISRDRVIRVLWPERYESAAAFQADVDRLAPVCRFLLCDAGKGGGGHGRSIDFSVFQPVVIQKDWFLAGGLGPDNVARALTACRPSGLDLNSGVESAPGQKDLHKLERVFAALRGVSEVV